MTNELRKAVENDAQVVAAANKRDIATAQSAGAFLAMEAAKKSWLELDEKAAILYKDYWRIRREATRRLATQEPSIILAGPNSRA